MTTMQQHTVDLEGVQIHYAEAGTAGSPVVLLHGITDSLDTYRAVIAALTPAAHVYALDLRGHGQSSHVPGGYRVWEYARDVPAFVERVVGQPATIAGHSLGGLVAAATAARAPRLVRGIVLEDPPMYVGRMPRFRESHFYPWFVTQRDMLDAHTASGRGMDDLVERLTQMRAAEGSSVNTAEDAAIIRYRAEQLHRLDPQTLDAAIDGSLFDQFDPDVILPQIVCAAHLLAGREELGGALSAADVQRIGALLPHGTFRLVEGVGHGIHVEQLAAYLHELMAFLATQR